MSQTDAQLGLYDKEAEAAVVAACLNSESIAIVAEMLTGEELSDPRLRLVARSAISLYRQGKTLTPNSVLAESRSIAAKGGASSALTAQAISEMAKREAGNPIAAASTVRNLFGLRRFTPEIEKFIDYIATRPSESDMARKLLEFTEFVMAENKEARDIVYGEDMPDFIRETLEKMAASTRRRFLWPWKAFSKIVPLMGGLMAVIGAADGQGKTAVAMAIADHWAKSGIDVMYIHTEYTAPYMAMRRLSSLTGLTMARLESGNFSATEKRLIDDAIGYVESWNKTFHWVYGGGKMVNDLVTEMSIQHKAGKCSAVVFDYFQDAEFAINNRDGQIGAYTDGMKRFHHALSDLDIPGIVVSQGRKDMIDARHDELTRTMLDLPAGAIRKSQATILMRRGRLDADGADTVVVNGMIRPYGRKGDQSAIIDWRCDKQNNGPAGTGHLMITNNFGIVDIPPQHPLYEVRGDDPREG